jgi:hypothetical protein
MFAIVAVALAVLVAVILLGIAVHILFSPLLLLVAIGIVVWIKFRPRDNRR